MAERRYCDDHGMQEVQDQFIEDTGDSRVTVTEYSVTALACGCNIERIIREYRSPLQQAGQTFAASAPDPFLTEGE